MPIAYEKLTSFGSVPYLVIAKFKFPPQLGSLVGSLSVAKQTENQFLLTQLPRKNREQWEKLYSGS